MRVGGLAVAALLAAAGARPTLPISEESSIVARAEAEKPVHPVLDHTPPPPVHHVHPQVEEKHVSVHPHAKEHVVHVTPAKETAKKTTTPAHREPVKQPARKSTAVHHESGAVMHTTAKFVSLNKMSTQQDTSQQNSQLQQNAPPPLRYAQLMLRETDGCNNKDRCVRGGEVCFKQLDDARFFESCMERFHCCLLSAEFVGVALPLFGCYDGTQPVCWPPLLPKPTELPVFPHWTLVPP